MPFKREAKLLTVIGLTTNMQTSHYICIISSTFVMYNFSELMGNVSPTYIFSTYRLSHHILLVPISPVAKEILIRSLIQKPCHSAAINFRKNISKIMISIS